MKQISNILLVIFLTAVAGCGGNEEENGGQQPAGGATVSAVTVIGTTATSIEVQAEVTDAGDTPVIMRGFAYGTSQQPDINDFTTENGIGVGTFGTVLAGLQPNTTYYVRAYAINTDATTNVERISYGPQKQVQTTAAAALPTVTTLDVTDIKQISAKATGKLETAGGSPVQELGICFVEDTGNNPTPTIDNRKITAAGTAGTYTVTLTGITNGSFWIMPGKTYRYRAFAINEEGNVGYGETLEFTNNTPFTLAGPNCTDASGNTYQTVILADLVWMASNLKTNQFITGAQAVPTGDTNAQWGTTQPRRCTPGGTLTQYGHLYNGYAALSTLGLLPQQDQSSTTQWRIPNRSDWEDLFYYLGGTGVAGKKMKVSSNWISDGNNSDNSSGFGAAAAGYRTSTGDFNSSAGNVARFWVNEPSRATYVELLAGNSEVKIDQIQVGSDATTLRHGFSVRCVRDY
jgi:uncharacterized protein (TIGR02145 family)